MISLSTIKYPILIADKEKVRSNILRMAQKADAAGATLRPHFKTHQSAETGRLFSENGIDKITVSSVRMALFFKNTGFTDITIAFPVSLREIDDINKLAGEITLTVLTDNIYSTEILAKNIRSPLNVMVKVDTGYHRSGILPDQTDIIDKITEITKKSQYLSFKGFLTHSGHSYHAIGKENMQHIFDKAKEDMQRLKNRYSETFPDIIISYGDTPVCSAVPDCSGFDELRPGNFVYYDIMQYHLGSCNLDDIAVAAACPVAGCYPQRNEIVIYGGAVHLSKEYIAADNGFKLYGYVVRFGQNLKWSTPVTGAWVSDLSQEHGIVKLPENEVEKIKPGDLIGILPVHSCLTANLLETYLV